MTLLTSRRAPGGRSFDEYGHTDNRPVRLGFVWLISHDWKYCWLIWCERKILFIDWKNMTYNSNKPKQKGVNISQSMEATLLATASGERREWERGSTAFNSSYYLLPSYSALSSMCRSSGGADWRLVSSWASSTCHVLYLHCQINPCGPCMNKGRQPLFSHPVHVRQLRGRWRWVELTFVS